jgi:hypothetical protein
MQEEDEDLVERELRKLETGLLLPEARHSPEALSSLLAEEFREFGSSGRIYTRQEIVDSLRTESAVRISVRDFSVTRLAADAALLTYRAVRHNESGPGDSISLRSSLWVRRENRWQMLFHQGTKAGE